MQTLRIVLLVIFWLDSILLVIAILLQSGRGGGLAGALGGIGSAESALGVRAASQIEKATGVLAAIFLAVALVLAFLSTQRGPGTSRIEIEKRGPVTVPAGVKPLSEPAGAKPASRPAGVRPPSEPAGTKPTSLPGGAQRSRAGTTGFVGMISFTTSARELTLHDIVSMGLDVTTGPKAAGARVGGRPATPPAKTLL